jgi:hypothetical protein
VPGGKGANDEYPRAAHDFDPRGYAARCSPNQGNRPLNPAAVLWQARLDSRRPGEPFPPEGRACILPGGGSSSSSSRSIHNEPEMFSRNNYQSAAEL